MKLAALTAMAIFPIVVTIHGPTWVPAVPPPVVTIAPKSAKFCLGPEVLSGIVPITRDPPVSANAIRLKLTVLGTYRNEGVAPMLLVPWRDIYQYAGLHPDRLEARKIRKASDALDVGPPSGTVVGPPLLRVPIDEVIPPGGYPRFPFSNEIEMTVFSPDKSKDSLLGKTLWFQLELVHWRLSQRLGQELMAQKYEKGTPWTGTIKTNILDFDVPPSPATEKCATTYRID